MRLPRAYSKLTTRIIPCINEVILTEPSPTSLFGGDSSNTLQWANYYPTLQTIAIGEHHAKYPTHGDVHAGFLAHLSKSPCITVKVHGADEIKAYSAGNDIIIPISDQRALLKRVSTNNPAESDLQALNQILDSYQSAVKEAVEMVAISKGDIVALIDTDSQLSMYQLLTTRYEHPPILPRYIHEFLPVVNGYVDGKNYIIRIEALKRNPHTESDDEESNLEFRAKVFEMVHRYKAAIEMATHRCQESGGVVLLQADGESQKFVAKLLGQLHQVDDPTRSVGEAIRKAIKESASGRYIYNANSGTRYYFTEDLKNIAEQAVITIASGSSTSVTDTLLSEHHEKIKNTIGELSRFLRSRNRMGNREGKFFLVNKGNRDIIDQSDIHTSLADKIEDVYQTVTTSTNWQVDQYRVQEQLLDIVAELRALSHPLFHKIDLSSPVFIDLLSKALRSGSSKIDLGADFSTPLNAQDFGYFRTKRNGEREFFVTTTNPTFQKLAHWLFSEDGHKALSSDTHPPAVLHADAITLYVPETPLTFEPHPTNFIRRFGHLEAKSVVIEFSRLGHSPERWVLEENVWAPARWEERNTDTVSSLRDRYDKLTLSLFVKNFKDAQYNLFSTLLENMRGTSVSLAPPYEWVSIEGLQQDTLHLDNVRIRRFINGKRSDRMKFNEWDYNRLAPTMEMLGDLMAAGIIAQLPHLPRRDIIIHKNGNQPAISGITFLSPGESFCHSSRAKNLREYLKDVVPVLYGNHIARWLAPIGYLKTSGPDKSWKITQRILAQSCVNRIEERLRELTYRSKYASARQNVLDEMNLIINGLDEGTIQSPPPVLDIATFLPFSKKLLDLRKNQIEALGQRIMRATFKELQLIEQIAPAPHQDSDIECWEEVDNCASAVSSLIEGHLAEAKRLQDAQKGLKVLANGLDLLSIPERTWFITVLDVNLRIGELRRKKSLGALVATAFQEASGEKQFYETIIQEAPYIDLAYETIAACYHAISGLRQSYRELDPAEPKAEQLANGLKELRPLGRMIVRQR